MSAKRRHVNADPEPLNVSTLVVANASLVGGFAYASIHHP
jgi:hypothetical protein